MPGPAAAALGGAPSYLLADNAKTITVEHVAGIPVRHPEIVAVGRHYGCKVESCGLRPPEQGCGGGDREAGQGRLGRRRKGADDREPVGDRTPRRCLPAGSRADWIVRRTLLGDRGDVAAVHARSVPQVHAAEKDRPVAGPDG